MNLQEQLSFLLPHVGRYCMFLKGGVRNYFFDTLPELAQAIEGQGTSEGVYMALASFAALDARTQANAHTLATLFLDLDCGAVKHATNPAGTYPSQQDAVQALAAFAKATTLRPSLIVDSGMGLHVYFKLDGDYPVVAVQRVMRNLKTLCKHLGLKADPACTSDTARVLRPVGTRHSIDAERGPLTVTALKQTSTVYALDDLDARIAALLPLEQTVMPSAFEGMPNINETDVLTYPKSSNSIEKVARHCSAVASVRDTLGNVPEPLWRAFIGIAKHCDVDGETGAHEWSSGYNGYDYEETQRKLDAWKTGPATCAHISDHHSGCAACPHNGKVTSPLQLGRVNLDVIAEESPAVPAPVPAVVPSPVGALTMNAEGEFVGGEPIYSPPPVAQDIEQLQRDRPELFEEPKKEGFFFVPVLGSWRLYHRKIVETPDVSGEGKPLKQLANICVAHQLFWLDARTLGDSRDNNAVRNELVIVDRVENPTIKRLFVPASCTANNTALAETLMNHGVAFEPEACAYASVGRYMKLEQIRTQHNMKYTVRTRFGFDWYKGEFLCAYGEHVLHADCSIERTISNARLNLAKTMLEPGFLPPSSVGIWDKGTVLNSVIPAAKRYAEFVRKYQAGPNMAQHRFALALGLASPYLVFSDAGAFTDGSPLPAGGLVVSLFSNDSGRAKTGVQKLIACAFGKGGTVIGGDAQSVTQMARVALASSLGVFPLLLDEVSQNDPKRQASEIQNFANGAARIRARSSGELNIDMVDWNLITVMSTNRPQAELVTAANQNTEALLNRLLEINFDAVTLDPANMAGYRVDVGDIMKDGGAIGVLLALQALRRGRDNMAVDCAVEFKRLTELFNAPVEARMYLGAFAATLVMNRRLRNAGVVIFDDEELLEQFRKALATLTGLLRENKRTPEQNFAYMVEDLAPNIMVTAGFQGRGRQGAEVVLNEKSLHLPIQGRQVNDTRTLFLSSKAVKNYCAQNRISAGSMLSALHLSGVLRVHDGSQTTRSTLTAGVMSVPEQGRTIVYEFAMTPATLSYAHNELAGEPPEVLAPHLR